MKHGIGCIVRIAPALGYDVGKISAGCLVVGIKLVVLKFSSSGELIGWCVCRLLVGLYMETTPPVTLQSVMRQCLMHRLPVWCWHLHTYLWISSLHFWAVVVLRYPHRARYSNVIAYFWGQKTHVIGEVRYNQQGRKNANVSNGHKFLEVLHTYMSPWITRSNQTV